MTGDTKVVEFALRIVAGIAGPALCTQFMRDNGYLFEPLDKANEGIVAYNARIEARARECACHWLARQLTET